MVDFGYQLLDYMNTLGIFTIIGPFLVVFSLFYGILHKSKIFGTAQTAEKIYAVISFALAIFYLYNVKTVLFTQAFLSFFFYELLLLFLLLIAISLIARFVEDTSEQKTIKRHYISGILSLTVLLAFLYASMQGTEYYGSLAESILTNIFMYLASSGLLLVIIMFIILIAIVAWMTSPPQQEPFKERTEKKLKDVLNYMLDLYESSQQKNQQNKK